MTQSRIIDLLGPDGNAFALMAQASHLAKQLSLDDKKIIAEMNSGDYKNLCEVFERYFSDYVELQNKEIATGELDPKETILPTGGHL